MSGDFEVCPKGTQARLAELNQAAEEWAVERATGQLQLDDATALMREAAELFRFYERSHRTKAGRGNDFCDVQVTLAKAERNQLAAERLEAWLAGSDRYPVSLPGEDTVVAHGQPIPADIAPYGQLVPTSRVIDFPGVTTRQQAERHPQSHHQRFANRDGYGSNVRPATGPLAEPGVADMLVHALVGDAPALGMDGPVFRLHTADPRFDPAAPVRINGFPYNPATED
jgi:hypothetical protein